MKTLFDELQCEVKNCVAAQRCEHQADGNYYVEYAKQEREPPVFYFALKFVK